MATQFFRRHTRKCLDAAVRRALDSLAPRPAVRGAFARLLTVVHARSDSAARAARSRWRVPASRRAGQSRALSPRRARRGIRLARVRASSARGPLARRPSARSISDATLPRLGVVRGQQRGRAAAPRLVRAARSRPPLSHTVASARDDPADGARVSALPRPPRCRPRAAPGRSSRPGRQPAARQRGDRHPARPVIRARGRVARGDRVAGAMERRSRPRSGRSHHRLLAGNASRAHPRADARWPHVPRPAAAGSVPAWAQSGLALAGRHGAARDDRQAWRPTEAVLAQVALERARRRRAGRQRAGPRAMAAGRAPRQQPAPPRGHIDAPLRGHVRAAVRRRCFHNLVAAPSSARRVRRPTTTAGRR